MTALGYTEHALTDLERLRDLLETDEAAAAQTLELITTAVGLLHQHPLIGRPAESGLRELVVSRGKSGYLALYLYDEARDRVLVLRLRHQREAGYLG